MLLKDNEGVAIQSNTERIYKIIEKIPEKIALSKVRYIDYEKDAWYHPINYPQTSYNLYIPLIHKRNEFKHENEFRLFEHIEEPISDENYWDNQLNYKGKLISIDLDTLIEKIYLPPTVDEKFLSFVKKFSKDLGYNFEFVKSKLSSEPMY